ncbi:hypothetical protein [Bifidobacterium aerophilum]|uniref:DUF3137 domain-containing protein n=1 Tax=Bifidobacterium aerophilum TaxID=1798155 RepID=A0A6N9Z4N5_9BIFI|nr:hypothetical protein [Bifidobacterium aerophilum]NEG89451.1 hypothetical protein [Bifidobacterium aerophilum]
MSMPTYPQPTRTQYGQYQARPQSVWPEQPYPTPDTQWPIVAQTYDPTPELRRHDRAVIRWVCITAALAASLLIMSTIWTLDEASTAYVLIGTALIFSFVMLLEDIYEDLRQRKLPTSEGFVITGRMIQQAYENTIPIQRLSLSTPIIMHDPFNTDDLSYFTHYQICPNEVYLLWFNPTTRTHSYLLYWSERGYDGLNTGWFGKYRMASYAKPTPRALRISQRFMRRTAAKSHVDLRMRPCMLEVNGIRARIILPPNAPELETGGQDPHISAAIDGVAMLKDTFAPDRR